MRRKNAFLLLALAGTLLLGNIRPVAIQALQEEPVIAHLTVSLWPEYDDPRLLVIYRGQFAAETTFPRRVTFRIPQGAEVNAAAYTTADGQLMANPWESRQEDGYQLISYSLPVPTFQFEFYDDAIQGQVDKRLSFVFQSLYPIESLEIEVQRPLRASNFQISPPPSEVTSDARGFQYSLYAFQQVAKDQAIELEVTYTKADPNPSVPKVQQLPTAEAQAQVPAQQGGMSPFLIFVGLAVLAAALGLGGVALVAFRKGRPPRPSPVSAGEGEERAVARFCTQCGARLQKGDRFCRQCGAKVKGIARERRVDSSMGKRKRGGRRAKRRAPSRGASPPRLVFLLVGSLVLAVLGAAVLWAGTRSPSSEPESIATPTTPSAASIPYPEVPRILVAEAKAKFDAGTAVVVDVRTAEEYAQAHISGALSIPLGELDQRYGELPRDKEIITYCT
ncbi:MAG: rhodanese-like domain-containing protein [Anaerolineae bacterium]